MLRRIKEYITLRLRDVVDMHLKNQVHEKGLHRPFGMSYWYEENLWEPTVQIALRDLCRPGDTVFDIGANFAGLTTIMSRMVGPKGIVCAFEASPRIIGKCQFNIVQNGCNNVQIYHQAVYSKSGVKVPIYLGEHLNDSIYTASWRSDKPGYHVQTIAMDDFVRHTGLVPSLIKIDIEDAEFDALNGMPELIRNHTPHLLLETQPGDTRCLDLLRENGYVAIDLNSYREVRGAGDYPQGVGVRNNIYIHRDRILETPYRAPFTIVEAVVLNEGDFKIANDGSVTLKIPIRLERGRYLLDVDFTASGRDNEMMCGVKNGDTVIFRYHSNTYFLAQSYRDWVIDLPEASDIDIYFNFMNNTRDESFSVKGVKVSRVAEFDSKPAQLYFKA